MSIEQLLGAYRQAAIRHGKASEAGIYKVANKAHDEIVEISHHFRKGSPEAQRAFLALLDDEKLSVQAWAATHALEIDPHRAVEVLRGIAAGPRGLERLGAEMVLKQWEEGTLYLP